MIRVFGCTLSRILFSSITIMTMVATTSCSNLDFRSPMAIGGMESPNEQNTIADDEEAERTDRLNKLIKASMTNAPINTTYHIGTEDTLEVSIYSLQTPGQYTVLKRKIDKDGAIDLPWVGRIPATKLTVQEIQALIVAAYKGKYLKDPEVNVSVVEYQSAWVWVTGAIGSPGLHYLKRDRTTLIELLSEVGGVKNDAGKYIIVTRGHTKRDQAIAATRTNDTGIANGESVQRELDEMKADMGDENGRLEIDIKALFDSGDPRWNVTLGNGDFVTVPLGNDKFINVLGYVRSPGTFPLSPDSPMTAWRALAKAGGPNDKGRIEMCYIIPESKDGKRKPIEVNIKDIIYGKQNDFPMQAGDTLVVGAPWYMKIKDIFTVGGSAGADYAVPTP